MNELKERYFCGIDFTKRSEYRNYILRLEAENECLNEEKQTAVDERHAWFQKYMEQKQRCEAIQRSGAEQTEQIANLRAKLAIADENDRNTKSYIEGIKKEREAALDKVERLEDKIKSLGAAAKEALDIAEKIQRESETQAKAYIELAHDYDLLKEDYDNLRVSVAINAATEPYINSIVEACEGHCSCEGHCACESEGSWKEADQTHEGSDEVWHEDEDEVWHEDEDEVWHEADQTHEDSDEVWHEADQTHEDSDEVWHEGEVIKVADIVPVAIQDTEGESVIVEEVAEQPKKNSSKRRKKRPKKNNE